MEISGAGRKGRKYKFWSKVGQLEQFEQQERRGDVKLGKNMRGRDVVVISAKTL